MIERKFIAEKMKELQVQEFIAQEIGKDKYSYIEIKKTPLGEKVIIFTPKPGLVVGKKGETIKNLTQILKTRFKMENPQVEVAEVPRPEFDAQTMAEYVVGVLERFGPKRFKSIGYKALQRIIDAGALGAEIVISGRGVPSSRAKSWRFYEGYLKKSGDVAETMVAKGFASANLRSGTVGIKVSIMPPGLVLPDRIIINEIETKQEEPKEAPKAEEIKAEGQKEEKKEKKAKKPRKPAKPKSEGKKKKEPKKEAKAEEAKA